MSSEQVSVYPDEGLEAFVFGVQLLVDVYGLVVAAAELPVNSLHYRCFGP